MTRTEAQRKLDKLMGCRTRLDVERWGSGVSSPERRAKAEDEYQRVCREQEAAKAEYERIVKEHAELQRLAARRKELYALKERLNHDRHYRKFEAYRSAGIGMMHIGHGDTWEEVITQVEDRKRAQGQ